MRHANCSNKVRCVLQFPECLKELSCTRDAEFVTVYNRILTINWKEENIPEIVKLKTGENWCCQSKMCYIWLINIYTCFNIYKTIDKTIIYLKANIDNYNCIDINLKKMRNRKTNEIIQNSYNDRSYWGLQYARLVTDLSEDRETGGLKYARLVMDFSENWVIGELQYASLVIGLTEGYSTLG